jgi:hypothetical protein
MHNQQDYEAVVRRLADHNYVVISDEQGYTVRRLTDNKDVSRIGNFQDLVELAGLIEWREQRLATRNMSRQEKASIGE